MYRATFSIAAVLMLVILPHMAVASGYPDQALNDIMKTAAYTGGDSCRMCHADIHGKLATSWHSRKTEWGPAHAEKYRKDKIYSWVVRDWDNLDTYMILDQKDRTTNYIAMDKVAIKDVDLVSGGQRKQRYAAYYDGGPRKAWLATTKDGGISWTIDKSKIVDYPGNKERVGYKFLFIEANPPDGKLNMNNYGEFYSWQERCIACHSTGFDHKGWEKAKADFMAGTRENLKDTFVADIRVSCEACHGPGSVHAKSPSKANIINPAKITDIESRKMVCEQCHTRTTRNLHARGANDLRGYRLGDKYEDHAEYTRPNWGKGNRATSIDGKGRRDHQQDMDMRLSATIKGSQSVHASMTCFDCHDAHNLGNNAQNPRLKKSKVDTCAACHKDQPEALLQVLDGSKGWPKYGYGNWNNEGGRTANKQHVFNFDEKKRSYGLKPSQYHWALKKDGNAKKEADWVSIWPWEKASYEKKGMIVTVGANPWVR